MKNKQFPLLRLITGLFIVFLIWVGYCTVAPKNIPQTIAVKPAPQSPAPLKTTDQYVKPVIMGINEACLQSNGKNDKYRLICANLAEGQIAQKIKVELMPESTTKLDRVYLKFFENNKPLNIPKYYFPSFIGQNPSWFELHVSFIDKNNIYVSDNGGFEGYPSHYFFNGKKWNKLDVWDLVKADFPDKTEPPFSLTAGPKYLLITEENYCCDTAYSDTAERKNYRVVTILNRLTQKTVEISKIMR